MTFEDYFLTLKNSHLSFRNKDCRELGISIETFYLKRKNNRWTIPQKETISKIAGIDIDILFP